jgi:serine protease Do
MPTATYTPVPAEPEAGGQAATDLIGVERATVRIIPQGTWAEPEGWAVNQTWSGSGFIIDPEGIAVTNNHVVTGAGLLEVYIQGRSEPENATVLGVSECSDLAVIDIDGEGYDYLEWADEPVTRYIDVYAAGFPGNATKVKITNGEVLDAGDVVETDWASVDIAITHSARIRPGNSGGPLVTRDGKVVGINYALSEHFDDSIAISRIEAEPIIDNLRAGLDDHSIGVNGQSFPVDDELAGIWVYSVAAGSPADRTGIQPGDVIASIELLYFEPDVYGLVTMETYCDVLRSHASSDVLNIEVWRPSVDEMLEGQINGRELEVAY